MLWQVWSRDEHSHPNAWHTELANRTGLTLRVDILVYTQYDIAPSAKYYDAVVGRRFYLWRDTSRKTVVPIILRSWTHIPCIPGTSSIVWHYPNVDEQLNAGLCYREAICTTAKLAIASQDMSLFQHQFVYQEIERRSRTTSRLPRFCLPDSNKTYGAAREHVLPSSWCNSRRWRCPPPGDPDDGAASPDSIPY